MILSSNYSRVASVFSMTPQQAMEKLGVQGTGTVEGDRKLLRGLSKKYHPDVAKEEDAPEKMSAVNVLWETYVRQKKTIPTSTEKPAEKKFRPFGSDFSDKPGAWSEYKKNVFPETVAGFINSARGIRSTFEADRKERKQRFRLMDAMRDLKYGLEQFLRDITDNAIDSNGAMPKEATEVRLLIRKAYGHINIAESLFSMEPYGWHSLESLDSCIGELEWSQFRVSDPYF